MLEKVKHDCMGRKAILERPVTLSHGDAECAELKRAYDDSQHVFSGAEGIATPGWEEAGDDGSGAATGRTAGSNGPAASR